MITTVGDWYVDFFFFSFNGISDIFIAKNIQTNILDIRTVKLRLFHTFNHVTRSCAYFCWSERDIAWQYFWFYRSLTWNLFSWFWHLGVTKLVKQNTKSGINLNKNEEKLSQLYYSMCGEESIFMRASNLFSKFRDFMIFIVFLYQHRIA